MSRQSKFYRAPKFEGERSHELLYTNIYFQSMVFLPFS